MTASPDRAGLRYGDDDGEVCPTCKQTVGAASPDRAGLLREALEALPHWKYAGHSALIDREDAFRAALAATGDSEGPRRASPDGTPEAWQAAHPPLTGDSEGPGRG